jgi:hypothetical protein
MEPSILSLQHPWKNAIRMTWMISLSFRTRLSQIQAARLGISLLILYYWKSPRLTTSLLTLSFFKTSVLPFTPSSTLVS